MGLFSWIVLGLFAGGTAGWITGRRAGGCLSSIAVGVLGAIIGGALARWAGLEGLGGFGLRTFVVATLGSVLLLLVLQALDRGPGRARRR